MLRRLILKLACVHSQNREWVLGQLSQSERDIVQPLLDEVLELGLNIDVATVNAVLSEHALLQDNSGAKENVATRGMEQLGAFWQQMVLSHRGENGAEPNTSAPFQSVPPQLAAVLDDIVMRKSYEFID